MPVAAFDLSADVAVAPIILPPATIDPDELDELGGSPQERFTDKGFSATRRLKTTWANRHALAAKLKGASGFDGEAYTYQRPARYPSFHRAFVQGDVGIEPFNESKFVRGTEDGGTVNVYEHAELTVEYATPEFDTDEEDGGGSNDPELLVSESVEPFAEWITLGDKDFYWRDGTVENPGTAYPIGALEAPATVIRGFTWVHTRHKLRTIPESYFEFVNTINKNPVTSRTLGYTFPAQCLLMKEPSLEREITTAGVQAWKVTTRFSFRKISWQLFFRVSTGKWERLWTGKRETETFVGYTVFSPYFENDFELLTG